jgi:hypothetical protein
MAIVSWRWDVDPSTGHSTNVDLVLREAASTGVSCLPLDVASIDQRLTGSALLGEVAHFSSLYERLPVFAAYDDPSAPKTTYGWMHVMRRPWILRELRAMFSNPHPITYVAHAAGQGTGNTEGSFGFRHMLGRVWVTSFTHSLLYVLGGQVGMYSPRDLRFVLPEHASILDAAFEQLGTNDFLLTAALLVQAQAEADDTRLNSDNDISAIAFDRYRLERDSEQSTGYLAVDTVLLDGEPVADWRSRYTRYDDYRRWLEVRPDAERTIHRALGLTDHDLASYQATAEARRRSLYFSTDARDAADEREIHIIDRSASTAGGKVAEAVTDR